MTSRLAQRRQSRARLHTGRVLVLLLLTAAMCSPLGPTRALASDAAGDQPAAAAPTPAPTATLEPVAGPDPADAAEPAAPRPTPRLPTSLSRVPSLGRPPSPPRPRHRRPTHLRPTHRRRARSTTRPGASRPARPGRQCQPPLRQLRSPRPRRDAVPRWVDGSGLVDRSRLGTGAERLPVAVGPVAARRVSPAGGPVRPVPRHVPRVGWAGGPDGCALGLGGNHRR